MQDVVSEDDTKVRGELGDGEGAPGLVDVLQGEDVGLEAASTRSDGRPLDERHPGGVVPARRCVLDTCHEGAGFEGFLLADQDPVVVGDDHARGKNGAGLRGGVNRPEEGDQRCPRPATQQPASPFTHVPPPA